MARAAARMVAHFMNFTKIFKQHTVLADITHYIYGVTSCIATTAK